MPKKQKRPAETNMGLLIAVALVIIAVGVASAILLFGKSQQAPGVPDDSAISRPPGPVDVYIGSSKYGTISMSLEDLESIKKAVEEYYGNLTGKRVVMFGRTTCPHCHNMMSFFESRYKGAVVYIWVDTDKYGEQLFGDVLRKEVNAGFPTYYAGGVPHMLVLGLDGYPRVVVVGEVTTHEFWDKLLK